MGALIACALLATGCATPPGGELHKELGKDAGKGSLALAVWIPEHVKGPLWIQFEKRNAQGRPTGIPISVLVDNPQGPIYQAMPARAGLRGYSLALPVPPGGYVLSRWLGEVGGKSASATSSYIGWPFNVTAGQITHLGHLSLDIEQPQDNNVVAYRLRAVDGTAADVDLLKRNIDVLRSQPWQAANLSGGVVAAGTATVGGTSHIFLQNTINYYQAK